MADFVSDRISKIWTHCYLMMTARWLLTCRMLWAVCPQKQLHRLEERLQLSALKTVFASRFCQQLNNSVMWPLYGCILRDQVRAAEQSIVLTKARRHLCKLVPVRLVQVAPIPTEITLRSMGFRKFSEVLKNYKRRLVVISCLSVRPSSTNGPAPRGNGYPLGHCCTLIYSVLCK
jgi:hypothetical protein